MAAEKMNIFKQEIVKLLKRHAKGVKVEELIEVPPDPKMGDYAFPCFVLAKKLKKNPSEIAKDFEKKLEKSHFVGKVYTIGPYLNFCINKAKQAEMTLKAVMKERAKYGSSQEGNGKSIVIDYSSPNIAKPFGIAHLRSTMIGNSLYRTYSFLGHKCIGVNHLGDWGTQFGKLIVAYKKWGEPEELEKSPINHLLSIYVRYHEEAKKDPGMDDEARRWFKRLELGDREAEKLWKKFSNQSLKEFKKIYHRLGVKFDSYAGESSYNRMIKPFIKEIEKKKLASISEGALVVDLAKFGMPPCILKKSDGATTYEARDLAAAEYRHNKYQFSKMLYVIDSRQSLHMQQIFKVFGLMGKKWARDCVHVNFGLMKLPREVMSTRKGKVIFLEDVLDKAKEKVLEVIKEKNPNLENKDKVAEKVAVGAITFWDLSHDRIRDIIFEWGKVLDFEGETGPYVQYAHARAASILRKAKQKKLEPDTKVDFALLKKPEEAKIINLLGNFSAAIESSAEQNKPSVLARFVLDLAQAFNEFYHNCPCLSEKDKEMLKSRLLLIACARQVLNNSLSLLGVPAPESM